MSLEQIAEENPPLMDKDCAKEVPARYVEEARQFARELVDSGKVYDGSWAACAYLALRMDRSGYIETRGVPEVLAPLKRLWPQSPRKGVPAYLAVKSVLSGFRACYVAGRMIGDESYEPANPKTVLDKLVNAKCAWTESDADLAATYARAHPYLSAGLRLVKESADLALAFVTIPVGMALGYLATPKRRTLEIEPLKIRASSTGHWVFYYDNEVTEPAPKHVPKKGRPLDPVFNWLRSFVD